MSLYRIGSNAGIFLLSFTTTTFVLAPSARISPWISLAIGLLLTVFTFGKNYRERDKVLFFAEFSITLLFGIFLSLYFLVPLFDRKPFDQYKIFFGLALAATLLAISYRQTGQIRSIWKTLAKNSVQSSYLFLFLPLVYSSIFGNILFSSWDTYGATLIPFSLDQEGNSNLNEFFGPYKEVSPSEFKGKKDKEEWTTVGTVASELKTGNYLYHPFFLAIVNDDFKTAHTLPPAVYNTAVFFFVKFLGIELVPPTKKTLDFERSRFYVERLSSSVLFALTSLLLLRALRRFASARTSLIVVLLYSFATAHFSIASNTLWQHTLVEFLAAIFLNLIPKSFGSYKKRFFLSGITLATIFFVRPPSVFLGAALSIPLFLEALKTKEITEFTKRGLYFLFGSSVSVLVFGALNYSEYGHLLGGYYFMNRSFGLVGISMFQFGSMTPKILGLLFSPAYGLFFCTPFLILTFFGWYLGRKKFKVFLLPSILSFGAFLLLYSNYFSWWGGRNYGNRFFTDTLPVLLVFTVPLVTLSVKYLRARLIFLPLALISLWSHFSVGFLEDGYIKWDDCNRLDYPARAWLWDRVPMMYTFRKFSPLATGELDYDPAYECHEGTFSGTIRSRKAFEFAGEFDFLTQGQDSHPILNDSFAYLQKGEYCLTTYAAVQGVSKGPNRLEILISLGKSFSSKTEYAVPAIRSDYSPNSLDIVLPKFGKYKFTVSKSGSLPISFAGFQLRKGTCTNQAPEKENFRSELFLPKKTE